MLEQLIHHLMIFGIIVVIIAIMIVAGWALCSLWKSEQREQNKSKSRAPDPAGRDGDDRLNNAVERLEQLRRNLPLIVEEYLSQRDIRRGQDQAFVSQAEQLREIMIGVERDRQSAEKAQKFAEEVRAIAKEDRVHIEELKSQILKRESDLNQKDSGLNEKKRDLDKKERDLDDREKKLDELANSKSKLIEDRTDLDRQSKQIADERKAMQTVRLELEQSKMTIASMETLILPRFLAESNLADWWQGLRGQSASNSDCAMLLACLHLFAASRQSENPEHNKRVFETLYQVGRAIYVLNKGGNKLAEASMIAAMAEQLNNSSGGLFQVKVAKIGDPPSPAWMNFRPGAGSISEVVGWAVYDGSGTSVRYRADVELSRE
jgi:hypothetical protein